MNKTYKTLATTSATIAMLLQMTMPAFAAYQFEISGNGSDTKNEVELERTSETGVFQNNNTNISNNISISSNTGDNKVNDNTGGDVDVTTGDTEVETTIVNQANVNEAHVEACDCDGDTQVKVVGNGTNSENEVELEVAHKNSVVQDNQTEIKNKVEIEAVTGDNETNDNTGGEVKLTTGDVKIKPISIANVGGLNTAVIGGGSNHGSMLSLKIAENGSDSDNDIDVDFNKENGIFQNNVTGILNDVYFGGFTGENKVNANTGDATTDPKLTTGDVEIMASIYNEAGFNGASSDCGCVLDVEGSILGNGTDSESELELDLDDKLETKQDNADDFTNKGEVVSDTGTNHVEDNTSGEVEATTGSTSTVISAGNFGGMNVFGSIQFEWPWN